MCLLLPFQEYSPDNHSPFPSDLAKLTGHIAAAIDFPEFHAEAAIVNYYHLDSTLAGHTDHSELDHEAPLISIRYTSNTDSLYMY